MPRTGGEIQYLVAQINVALKERLYICRTSLGVMKERRIFAWGGSVPLKQSCRALAGPLFVNEMTPEILNRTASRRRLTPIPFFSSGFPLFPVSGITLSKLYGFISRSTFFLAPSDSQIVQPCHAQPLFSRLPGYAAQAYESLAAR